MPTRGPVATLVLALAFTLSGCLIGKSENTQYTGRYVGEETLKQIEPGDVLYRFRSPQWPELQHEIIMGEQEIETALAEIDVVRARISESERRLALARDRLSSLSDAEIRNADLEAQAAEIEASLPRIGAELRQAETKLANRSAPGALYSTGNVTSRASSSHGGAPLHRPLLLSMVLSFLPAACACFAVENFAVAAMVSSGWWTSCSRTLRQRDARIQCL